MTMLFLTTKFVAITCQRYVCYKPPTFNGVQLVRSTKPIPYFQSTYYLQQENDTCPDSVETDFFRVFTSASP